jgi:hypothetical protein
MLSAAGPLLAIGLPSALLTRHADTRVVGRIAAGLGLILGIAALALLRLGRRD